MYIIIYTIRMRSTCRKHGNGTNLIYIYIYIKSTKYDEYIAATYILRRENGNSRGTSRSVGHFLSSLNRVVK
jgi:hypothetical protein